MLGVLRLVIVTVVAALVTLGLMIGCGSGLLTPSDGDGDDGDTTAVAPGAVLNLERSVADGAVTLSWEWPSGTDVDHLEIEVDPVPEGVAMPITIMPGSSSRAITGLVNNTRYTFTIHVVGSSGEESEPATITATPTTGSEDEDDGGVDSDGDGITDAVERAGWEISIYSTVDGEPEVITVTSDPNKADTDGDGLSDGEEKAPHQSNPRSTDTDNDGLSDWDEVKIYQSLAYKRDSDGDAHGDTRLEDYAEATEWFTSPSMSDTDGDGLSDYDEIVNNLGNPLVADLPKVELWTQSARIELDYEQNEEITTVNSTLTSNRSANAVNTISYDSANTKVVNENSESLHAEVEGSYGPVPSVSAKVSTDISAKETTTNETFSSFTEDTTRESESMYESFSETTQSTSVQKKGGRLDISLMIDNVGDTTFTIEDLEITVLYRSESNPSGYETIGQAVQPSEDRAYSLTPGQSKGPLAFNMELLLATAERLMRAPQGILFEVVNYRLLDEGGNDFAFVGGDDVNRKTGFISIDYGDGRTQKHQVATNVRYADGEPAGILLVDALEGVLDLDVEIDDAGNIASIDSVATAVYSGASTDWQDGFWALLGTDEDVDYASVAHEELALRQGEGISLVYLKDTDRDGLFDREEAVYGSDPTLEDTDGDGLNDYEEVKEGWEATQLGVTETVYTSPSSADPDGDGLNDAEEKEAGTHPFISADIDTDGDGLTDVEEYGAGLDSESADTDGDGISDGNDLAPLSHAVGFYIYGFDLHDMDTPNGNTIDNLDISVSCVLRDESGSDVCTLFNFSDDSHSLDAGASYLTEDGLPTPFYDYTLFGYSPSSHGVCDSSAYQSGYELRISVAATETNGRSTTSYQGARSFEYDGDWPEISDGLTYVWADAQDGSGKQFLMNLYYFAVDKTE